MVVDVIIPVYRPEREKLTKLIDWLNKQTVKPSRVFFMQTLVEKNEDEEVLQMLQKAENVEIVPIEKKDFDHGGTRNKGAALSKADYMLFMTQDAVPVDAYLIENLVQAMEEEEAATAYGRQLPDDTVGVIEHYTREFNYPAKSYVKSQKDLETMGIKTYFCSNVCAMYRKDVYEKMGGFVLHTIFNEDMIMASKVIQAGYKIAYVAEAMVIHAHKYTYRQQFTRNFDLAVSQRQYHEVFDAVKSESEGMRLVKNTMKYLFRHGKWYLVPDLIFQSGFKFLGYRFGKKYDKLPLWLVKKFSDESIVLEGQGVKEQVEIVMATYNGEKYIKEQLDSLLSQSHPYLLVDVCDDGFTDDTVSIVKEYEKKDSRVRLFENKTNQGYIRNFMSWHCSL